MKRKRRNISIIEIIKLLLKRLSGFGWIKRKSLCKKPKIEAEEILGKIAKETGIVSEFLLPIQPEVKPEREKKEAKEEWIKDSEKVKEMIKETKHLERKEETEGKPLELKQEGKERVKEKPEEEMEEKAPLKVQKKPYVKKAPTEEQEKKPRELPTDKKKQHIEKKQKAIDLGNASKSKYRRIIHPSQEEQKIIVEKEEEKPKDKKSPIRIEAPFVEIDLDESKISLVLPGQQFRVDSSGEIPKEINYKIKINKEEQKEIPVKVNSLNQNIVHTSEKRIYLEEPLKSFEVTFPDELQGRKYYYNHRKKILYAFVAIGNNRGRMCYLYDSEGNFTALPKKNIWVLLNEDFELITEEVIVEESKWIWDAYRPFLVNLKEANNLIMENRETGDIEKLPCCNTFSIEGEQLIEDDFKEGSPLLIGDTLKIKAPIENPSGWCVWIQSKGAGHKIVKENWYGIDELKLNLPDCLPCEYGEFQIDICPKEAGEANETLFFRWIDFIELKYPKYLIIPDPIRGSKIEYIEIGLNNIEDWNLRSRENLKINKVENNIFKVEVPSEKDLVYFSLTKKVNPENEFKLQITIPRLKWRTSKQSSWRGKLQKIKKETLKLEDYLIIRTNDWRNKYDLIAALEMNGKQLQEARFIHKGIEYLTDLRQFYDTIKKNKDDLTIKAKIFKDSQLIGTVNVLNFQKEIPIARKILKQEIKARGKTRRISKVLPFVKSKDKLRKGKGFSKEEIEEAVMDIDNFIKLNVPYDKRRKSSHRINIEALKKLKKGN